MDRSPISKGGQRSNGRAPRRRSGSDKVESSLTMKKQLHDNADESSPVIQNFLTFQQELDLKHDKRERIIKLGRDTTICSKRVIFMLHRSTDDGSLSKVLQEADSKVEEIRGYLTKIAQELVAEDPYKFAKAYSGGLQEFVEAVTFMHYIRESKLLQYEDLCEKYFLLEGTSESDVPHFHMNVLLTPIDYILGIADLTGELMRMCINQISAGDQGKALEICYFLRTLHDQFLMLSGRDIKDLRQKMKVLKQSLTKVENACYTVKLRGSEVPRHMLVDLIQMKQLSEKLHSTGDGGDA